MNHYYTTQGERITQGILDGRIRKAGIEKINAQRSAYGYNFCEDCGLNETAGYLDVSHNKSRQWCKNNRCAELAYDQTNLTVRCRLCHKRHDGL